MAVKIQGTNSAAVPAVSSDGNDGLVVGTDTIDLSIGGASKFKVGAAGQLGIGGATYGTDGQVLTSTGASSAPAWETAPGDLKLDTVQTKDCFSGQAAHDEQHLVFNVGAGCTEWHLGVKALSCGATDQIQLTLGHSSITYSDSYLGNLTWTQTNSSQGGHDLDSTVAQLNKDWHANTNLWYGVIRGVKNSASASGSYHIWQVETMWSPKDSGGMVFSTFSCQLSNGDNPLTAVRLSSESATGFDNGTVRYTGILKV